MKHHDYYFHSLIKMSVFDSAVAWASQVHEIFCTHLFFQTISRRSLFSLTDNVCLFLGQSLNFQGTSCIQHNHFPRKKNSNKIERSAGGKKHVCWCFCCWTEDKVVFSLFNKRKRWNNRKPVCLDSLEIMLYCLSFLGQWTKLMTKTVLKIIIF